MRISKAFGFILLCLMSLLMLLPFYIMIVMGTYYSQDMFTNLVLLPGNYLVENLRTVLTGSLIRAYSNSLYIALLSTAITLFICSLTGYAFAKYKFKGQQILFTVILVTMMVPNQLGLIAYVIEMKQFHLIDTHIPLLLGAFSNAFGVFFMTQFIKSSVPTEVIESARIDGAGEFRTYLQIVLPFLKPALSSLAILSFLGAWNNYLLPLVVINKPELYTLPLSITSLTTTHRTDYSASILGLSIGTIPLIIIFLFGSKSLVRGLTSGAVKG